MLLTPTQLFAFFPVLASKVVAKVGALISVGLAPILIDLPVPVAIFELKQSLKAPSFLCWQIEIRTLLSQID